jgi:hypothetical protein
MPAQATSGSLLYINILGPTYWVVYTKGCASDYLLLGLAQRKRATLLAQAYLLAQRCNSQVLPWPLLHFLFVFLFVFEDLLATASRQGVSLRTK